MTFREWQQLSPARAAAEVHRRVRELLSPAQQRAAIALLVPERELAAQFERAQRPDVLAGVPYLAKDLFDVAGRPTRAGSTFLPEVRPTPATDSAMVQALSDRGAVLAGKTHLHEFAYGITGENPHYGDCEHPRFPGRTTGGSSSGSAAAVAAGVVPLALGTDTGGSVRVPAAFCGLYGFRMTPGHAWIRDAVALAPSYDTAGWFTATADDMRHAIESLVGLRRAGTPPRGCFLELPGVDSDVSAAFRSAAAQFAPEADATTRDELLNGFRANIDTYHTTVALEAWEVHRPWAERYRERYDPVVWQRLTRAQQVTPAQRDAAAIGTTNVRKTWESFFNTYDFLVLPASPSAALTKAECTLENRNRVLTLTAPASIGGLPVLTLPVPLPSRLTTGLQIVVKDALSPAISWALER